MAIYHADVEKKSGMLCLLLSACGPASQPASLQTVAAYEVPLSTAANRRVFYAILDEAGRPEDYHVDYATEDELKDLSQVSPMTMNAAVWRGRDEVELIGSASDYKDSLGHIYLTFGRGENPERNTRFQERAVRATIQRWPMAKALPVLPGGNIPFLADLIWTSRGYRLRGEAAKRYDIPANSPLIAH